MIFFWVFALPLPRGVRLEMIHLFSFMETLDRIAKLFFECREKRQAAFVSYVCACDPDFDHSLEVCKSLIENGTDILELGVPFSDPLADGLTNQLAAQRALEAGCDQRTYFAWFGRFVNFLKSPSSSIPITI